VDPSTRVRISALAFRFQLRFSPEIVKYSLSDLAYMGEAFTAPTQGSQSFQLVKPEYADASIRRAIADERLTEDDTACFRPS
jgi:hypothetical protein